MFPNLLLATNGVTLRSFYGYYGLTLSYISHDSNILMSQI